MRKQAIAILTISIAALSLAGCGSQTVAIEPTVPDVSVEEQPEVEEPEQTVTLALSQDVFGVAFYLTPGTVRQLGVTTDYNGKITYRSSNDAVAGIDDTGMVTAKAEGKAVMTVTAGDVSRDIAVIVRTIEEPEEAEEEPEGQETAENGNGQTSGTTGGTATQTAAAGGTGSNTAAAATEAPAFNPADYYLDWDYIQSQVNSRLKADYPNCTIGTSYIVDGVTIQSGWGQGGYTDGVEWLSWTNETMIDNIYKSIKVTITERGGTSDSVCGAIGMFVQNITVNADGSRDITFITCP